MAPTPLKQKEESTSELPKAKPPKEEKVDWKARAEELEEENDRLREKPTTCPRCQRSDCCGVKKL